MARPICMSRTATATAIVGAGFTILGAIGFVPQSLAQRAGAPQALARNAPAAAAAIATTTDLNRFLDAEQPDPARIAAMRAAAAAAPPAGLGSAALSAFYLQRSSQRALLGQQDEAIADAEMAIRTGRGTSAIPYPAQIALGLLLIEKQDMRRAIGIFSEVERDADRPGSKGWVFVARRGIAVAALALGEKRRAEQALARQRVMLREARAWPAFAEFGNRWVAQVEATTAFISLSDHEFERAEAAAQRAEQLFRRGAAARSIAQNDRDGFLRAANVMLAAQARAKFNQGRLAEAETDFRAAVIAQIRAGGKYQLAVADFLAGLQHVKFLQGQYGDALAISDRIFHILDTLGQPNTSVRWVRNMNARAWLLGRMNRPAEIAEAYRQVDEATEGWQEQLKQNARLPPHRMAWLVNSNRSRDGIGLARQALDRMTSIYGADHFVTALSRGNYAAMLSRTRQISESLAEFRKALPIILGSAAEDRDDIESGGTAGMDQPARFAVLNYLYALSLLPSPSQADLDEAFRYAESVRTDSVQRALLAASARATLRNPQLAALVRRDQDAEKQIAAAVDTLRAALAAPPEQRDARTVTALQTEVANLRKGRAQIRQEISRRAPSYAELIRPETPSIAQLQAVMQPGEVYVSIHVGELSTFVWAIPQQGEAQFARAAIGRVRVGELVNRIRNGLSLAGASLLDIPDFDVEASAMLYGEIFKPVQASLDRGDKLLVSANGTIAGLPFGLLAREVPPLDQGSDPMFAAYRRVPWLIRTHAITMLPSAATLRSLRTANAAAPGRQPFIGFGDPLFNRDQTAERGAAGDEVEPEGLTTRGRRNVRLAFRNLPKPAGVDQAAFGQLQRLPDTAEELTSIARALGGDASGSVFLQRDANERRVRSMDLTRYKVVAFATHGLTPGELPGLRSPALALTAPDVAGIDGDGLLTMEEVLQLRLDADWVVLSACNTGSGLGEGAAAEAASGLARAFFYAGSRALLVTGWAVHSASARDLVTDLFRRQAETPGTPRAAALQKAMLDLLDNGVIRDPAGGIVASYAHPVFWAPYVLMGEGGAPR